MLMSAVLKHPKKFNPFVCTPGVAKEHPKREWKLTTLTTLSGSVCSPTSSERYCKETLWNQTHIHSRAGLQTYLQSFSTPHHHHQHHLNPAKLKAFIRLDSMTDELVFPKLELILQIKQKQGPRPPCAAVWAVCLKAKLTLHRLVFASRLSYPPFVFFTGFSFFLQNCV